MGDDAKWCAAASALKEQIPPLSKNKNRRQVGQEAEERACAYLVKQGLQLVKRNFLCKMGELDIVMLQGNVLVFVEVRYRKGGKFGSALETVTWHKQQKLIKAAMYFLLLNKKYAALPCRFDVVSIMPAVDSGIENLQWVKDAFQG
jgi:putative endonuclease